MNVLVSKPCFFQLNSGTPDAEYSSQHTDNYNQRFYVSPNFLKLQWTSIPAHLSPSYILITSSSANPSRLARFVQQMFAQPVAVSLCPSGLRTPTRWGRVLVVRNVQVGYLKTRPSAGSMLPHFASWYSWAVSDAMHSAERTSTVEGRSSQNLAWEKRPKPHQDSIKQMSRIF